LEPPIELDGFTVAQIWHERSEREPAQIWLRDVVLKLAQESQQ